MGWGIAAGIAITFFTIAVGWWIDSDVGTEPTADSSVDVVTTPRPTTCDDFCNAYQSARMKVCSAQKTYQTAQAYAQHMVWLVGIVCAVAAIAPWASPAILGPIGPEIGATGSAVLWVVALLLLGMSFHATYAAIQAKNELNSVSASGA
jgi:hypothetical protein